MKKLGVVLVALLVAVAGYSRTYDEFSPVKRMSIAADWLDTGKAFQKNNKPAKAKACFSYVIEVFPMGATADEARGILKTSFGTDMPYDADQTFKFFVNRAQSMANLKYRLNNYLMALEIKEDKVALQKTALVYLRLGDKMNAAAYLKRAVNAGLTEGETDPALKGL